MKPIVILLTLVMVLFAASSDNLKAGKKYSALGIFTMRVEPTPDSEKVRVLSGGKRKIPLIPFLHEVTFTGKRAGIHTEEIRGKSITDSFVEIVYNSDTGWVLGAMIGESWNHTEEILSYLNTLVTVGETYDQGRFFLHKKYWEDDQELLDEYDCDHLWQYWFTHSERVIIGIKDGVVIKRIVPLSFGSRTPRSYDVDLGAYLNSPDLEEVCTTTIDLGHYETPDGCYLKGLNE